MEYSRIVAVTGLPGLYEILNSKTDGAIVRSLDDGSTKFVSSRVHNLTHLESIEIYTTGENASLSDVFAAMKDSATALPDVKDNKALQQYFKQAFPQLDFDRVYTSDMKKIVNWYKVIQQHNIDFTVKEAPEETEMAEVAESPQEVQEEQKTETPKKPAKKAAAKTKEEPVAEAEKPKATRKKKKTDEE